MEMNKCWFFFFLKAVVLLRSKDINDRKWELMAIPGVFVLLSPLNVAVNGPGYAIVYGWTEPSFLLMHHWFAGLTSCKRRWRSHSKQWDGAKNKLSLKEGSWKLPYTFLASHQPEISNYIQQQGSYRNVVFLLISKSTP